jgi:hypothetical protein
MLDRLVYQFAQLFKGFQMRIAFLIATLALGLRLGLSAHATVNEYQEQQADRFCQIDPNYCK